jgi:sulfhydrogenase subunit gamma (sulfur reductase)
MRSSEPEMKEKNPYLPIPVRVRRAFVESEDRMLKTLDLEFVRDEDAKAFEHVPGQFCELSIPGKGEAPFGIASSPTEEGFLRFTINKAGVVTTALHYLAEGEHLGVRGPLGNWYPVDEFKGRNVVIIGGGFAFTTLRSLLVYLLEHREDYGDITVVYGARAPGLLLYRDELREWEKRDDLTIYITVDKGDDEWTGLEGLVPAIVEQKAPSSEDAYAVICGPPIMIRFTLPVVSKLGFRPDRMYTSLERRMKCGLGLCGRCNIGPHYVCKDGPVFSYAQLEGLPKEY